MNVFVKTDGEWLYPDEAELNTKPYDFESIELSAPLESLCGIQVLITDLSGDVSITDISVSDNLPVKINVLREVCVNFNTAEEMEGFEKNPFVYANTPEPLPKHITRRAPFYVYDAYKPYEKEKPENGKIAFYIEIMSGARSGKFEKLFCVKSGGDERIIRAVVRVYNVSLPKRRSLKLTNWFSLKNMAYFHKLEPYGDEHFKMIEKYADAMRSIYQTHFLLPAELIEISESNGEYTFDLSLLKKIADIFFKKGFEYLEFGPVGTRKRVYHEDLNVLGIDGLLCAGEKGERALESFFKSMADMAYENGWQDKIIIHIADEPDEPKSAIEKRMEQYGAVCAILRKYLPEVKVCEAVKTALFKDYIDVLVPLSKTFEDFPQEFITAKNEGKEIWFYTCCVPTGNYYQRFIDVPVISGRYLFWSASRFNMSGYLHWGFNYMEKDQHPFNQTNQYHTYGDGVCLPSGDSHIVYPDKDKLYYSMRMVNYRKGADDFELLNMLKSRDEKLYESIVSGIVHSFHGNTDLPLFEKTYNALLKALEE